MSREKAPAIGYERPKDTEVSVNSLAQCCLNTASRNCYRPSIRVLTHQKNAAFFCMLFFEVLPFTTLAVSVNSKTSKKSVQKTRRFFGVSRPLGFQVSYGPGPCSRKTERAKRARSSCCTDQVRN